MGGEWARRTEVSRGALWIGLGLSGTAAVANQVLWQRGLSVVGGAGSLSTMLAVLVFMAGLGVGGLLGAAYGDRLGEPMRALSRVELSLAVVNAAIAWMLAQPAGGGGIGALWQATLGSAWLLSFVALGLLLPPTVLMGATLPLAAEARQRLTPGDDRRDITRLFAVNTTGAVVGAAATGLWLLPTVGQLRALLVACGLNAAAAAVLWLGRPTRVDHREANDAGTLAAPRVAAQPRRATPTRGEAMGFALGLLSLGYEMYLMRLATLHHGPYPYTFALTLCGFLACWALGAYGAARAGVAWSLRSAALWTAFGVLLAAALCTRTRSDTPGMLQTASVAAAVLPVVGFGLLYGRLVSEGQARWSLDVGRFYALNTLGACLGVLGFSLLGYQLQHVFNALVVAVGLGAVGWLASEHAMRGRVTIACSAAAVVLIVAGWAPSGRIVGEYMTFHGRDGVVELDRSGNVMVDGLWHSRLSTDGNHVGKLYNWGMAVAGVLARGQRPLRHALVIGNGVGITAATLATLPQLHIDAYEINRTLRAVMARYPRRSLGAASHPRIDIRWSDGRAGLLNDPQRYDLIVSSPLHLSQAGSTLLLSVEYLQLLKRRLTDGGVVVLFSDEGHAHQAAMVAATVRSRFAHVATFDRRLITVASDAPMALGPSQYARALRRDDPLMRQLAQYERAQAARSERGLLDRHDGPLPPAPAGTRLIRDDIPRVEYPQLH